MVNQRIKVERLLVPIAIGKEVSGFPKAIGTILHKGSLKREPFVFYEFFSLHYLFGTA